MGRFSPLALTFTDYIDRLVVDGDAGAAIPAIAAQKGVPDQFARAAILRHKGIGVEKVPDGAVRLQASPVRTAATSDIDKTIGTDANRLALFIARTAHKGIPEQGAVFVQFGEESVVAVRIPQRSAPAFIRISDHKEIAGRVPGNPSSVLDAEITQKSIPEQCPVIVQRGDKGIPIRADFPQGATRTIPRAPTDRSAPHNVDPAIGGCHNPFGNLMSGAAQKGVPEQSAIAVQLGDIGIREIGFLPGGEGAQRRSPRRPGFPGDVEIARAVNRQTRRPVVVVAAQKGVPDQIAIGVELGHKAVAVGCVGPQGVAPRAVAFAGGIDIAGSVQHHLFPTLLPPEVAAQEGVPGQRHRQGGGRGACVGRIAQGGVHGQAIGIIGDVNIGKFENTAAIQIGLDHRIVALIQYIHLAPAYVQGQAGRLGDPAAQIAQVHHIRPIQIGFHHQLFAVIDHIHLAVGHVQIDVMGFVKQPVQVAQVFAAAAVQIGPDDIAVVIICHVNFAVGQVQGKARRAIEQPAQIAQVFGVAAVQVGADDFAVAVVRDIHFAVCHVQIDAPRVIEQPAQIAQIDRTCAVQIGPGDAVVVVVGDIHLAPGWVQGDAVGFVEGVVQIAQILDNPVGIGPHEKIVAGAGDIDTLGRAGL